MKNNKNHLFTDIAKAYLRSGQYLKETPLLRSRQLSQKGGEVFYKLENLQPTGSFKVRGATNKLLSLRQSQSAEEVVTASTGNHGAALGYILEQFGGKATVFVPENTPDSKLRNIQNYAVTVIKFGLDAVEAEIKAREYAAKLGIEFISPYNDLQIIAGQGTIGFELYRQNQALDAVFVALGGGGLASGLSVALANLSPSTQVIACSPSNSKVMMESVKAGKILNLPSLPTLSDGTAGGVEEDSITLGYCKEYINEFIEVTETEIATALRLFFDDTHMVAEGAAGVALSGYLKSQEQWKDKNIAIIICGGNINRALFKEIL